MKIYVWGIRSNSGFGTHFGNFIDTFKKYHLFRQYIQEVNIAVDNLESIARATTDNDLHIIFPSFIDFDQLKTPPIRGKFIKWAIFETDLLPYEFLRYINNSDAVWTPTNWAYQILKNSGVPAEKIDIIPEGVDTTLYHPFLRSFFTKDDTFRFFMFGKCEERKGYPELLEGFQKAFGNNPNVILFLIADYYSGEYDLQKEINRVGLTNVRLHSNDLDINILPVMFNDFDAFIFPSRAEAWGLTLIEALACGIPTITTFYSGQTEYLRKIKDNIICLDYKIQKIECKYFNSLWGDGGNWAKSSPNEIARALLEMKNNIDYYRPKALEASTIIRREFSWLSSVDKGISSLIGRNMLPFSINSIEL